MNQDGDLAFYRQLWERLVGDEFTPQKLAGRVRADAGYDIEGLSDATLLELIEGRFSGAWTDVSFSFSELLAYYAVPEAKKTAEQVVGWVFASFVISDVIRAAVREWDFELDKFLDGFSAVRDRLEPDESVHVFQRVFHG